MVLLYQTVRVGFKSGAYYLTGLSSVPIMYRYAFTNMSSNLNLLKVHAKEQIPYTNFGYFKYTILK